jgi:hypothetical protein
MRRKIRDTGWTRHAALSSTSRGPRAAGGGGAGDRGECAGGGSSGVEGAGETEVTVDGKGELAWVYRPGESGKPFEDVLKKIASAPIKRS